MYFWRTTQGQKVDVVLYGERGILAIEVNRGVRVARDAIKGPSAFLEEYPMARAYLLYGGDRTRLEGNIRLLPVEDFLKHSDEVLEGDILAWQPQMS